MALFSISIGDNESFEAMRKIHSTSGIVFQYTFLIFQGFIMINIFLAIIVDSYAEVTSAAKARGHWWHSYFLQASPVHLRFSIESRATCMEITFASTTGAGDAHCL
jgi:hypothetical protein